jgi:hypothetical protein
MKTIDLLQFIEEGQRAYRLKKSIGDCPNFDNQPYRKAWKAGYYSARYGVSAKAALETLLKELDGA